MKEVFIKLCCFLFFFSQFSSTHSQQWFAMNIEDTLSPGAQVQSFFSDGSVLYVGGGFLMAGSDTVYHIAKWNTSNWEAMAEGIYYGNIWCISKYHEKIFAGGAFPNNGHLYSDNIDCWNGIDWIGVPNAYGEISNLVAAFAIYDNMLIVGGGFNAIGPIPFNFSKIAAYNDTNYISLGNLPQEVHALAVYNGELFAGGYFPTVKKYNGSAWQDVSGNFNYYIQDFEVDTFNNFLYVGGGFNVADDTIVTDNVVMWDGFKWNKVGYGNGYPSDVACVKIYRGDIYAGLVWDTIGGTFTGYLARWDGQNWYPAGDTLDWGVMALEIYRDTLYVGGTFNLPGLERGSIGKWYMPPDTTCKYLQPRVFAIADTFTTFMGAAWVQLYNNNAYADMWSWDFDDGTFDTVKDPYHKFQDTGSYNVTVTVTHEGCVKSASKVITVVAPVGVEEYSRESLDFKLYPNPTTGNVTVEVTIPQNREGELRSYSMYGSLLGTYPVQSGFNKVLIPSSRWSPGTALVVLMIDGRQVVVEKVVKK